MNHTKNDADRAPVVNLGEAIAFFTLGSVATWAAIGSGDYSLIPIGLAGALVAALSFPLCR